MTMTSRGCRIAVFLLVLGPIRESAGQGVDRAPGGRALIIVGLAGDAEHERLFRDTIRAWRDWLSGPLGFEPGRVGVLSGGAPATRDSITRAVETLRKERTSGDRLWVFVLGHANVEDGHAYLHLPGPDLRDDEFGALFRGLVAGEQVFWLTTAGSGRFLPAFSAPGRIVVAATEREGELNETEFPHALAEVARRPAEKLDLDGDGRVSVREIYGATVTAVNARFAADQRIPTEHAQLDDDGDGAGTELVPGTGPAPSDGALASKSFLPAVRPRPPTNPPARSDHERK